MNLKLNALLAATVLSSVFASANALTVLTGNNPQPNQSNVIRDGCGLPDATGVGTTIAGCLNDNHSQLVAFSSDESLQYDAGGQARVEGTTGAYSRLTIKAENTDIQSLILNINASADGFVAFSDGVTNSSVFALDGNGQNFFTILGPFSTLLLATFSDSSGTTELDLIDDTRQVRLSLANAVPEPETYALMLAGLGLLGAVARRRKA